MEQTSLFELFRSFFKIGMFTFGGGYAMVPLIEAEVIERRRWLAQDEFLDLLALAEKMNLEIRMQRSDIFDAMHRI